MSNITKILASQLTTELLKQRKEKVNEVTKELQLEITEIYKSTLPKEVLAVFKTKNKQYLNEISYVHLHGSGLNHQLVSFVEWLPSCSNNSTFIVPTKYLNKIVPLVNKEAELKEKLRNDEKVIKATILSLRTFAKVKDAFPEIAHLLKENPKTELVNIQQVRKLLK